MSDRDPAMSEPPGDHTQPPSSTQANVPAGAQGQFSGWRKLRMIALGVVIVVGSGLLFSGMLTGSAAWYTSRPAFCNSCHIMEPYYVSWQESSHHDVSCIKCHFPPGVGEKVRGKFLGLVQLAKYVTHSESPRPVAEIPDASCLRSGCHETRLLAGLVDFHGIPFDHAPHLEALRRGKQLRCTSCHSQIVQGKHMTVTTSTCFLCHFKDGHFNEGVGACTRCHQIPDQEFDLGGGVTFHHDLAYEQGVDCTNCHGDVIRGKGEVPHERCTVCHNRPDDLERIEDHVFLHKNHVTDHKVDCLDCHLQIEHSLDTDKVHRAASDCTACHPNHHQQQINMLQGVGGKSMPAQFSSMAASRIACPTCHRVEEVSSTGAVLMKASMQTCTACHDVSQVDDLHQYHVQINEVVAKLEESLPDVRSALNSATLDAERAAALTSKLNDLEDDLSFLRIGNGIHNLHYAGTLTRSVVAKLTSLCGELNIEPPGIKLPERVAGAE